METFGILISTILLRPYVFVLLGFYLIAGSFQLGLKRIVAFTILAYFIAFVSEYASTRIGIPYGFYHYTGETHGKELFISNVPFMDSLFVLFPGILQLFSCPADSFSGNQERVEICTVASILVFKKSKTVFYRKQTQYIIIQKGKEVFHLLSTSNKTKNKCGKQTILYFQIQYALHQSQVNYC